MAQHRTGLAAAVCLLSLWTITAETLFFRGRVLTENGQPPAGAVAIERACIGTPPVPQGLTNKKNGSYVWRAETDAFGNLAIATGNGLTSQIERQCILRASLPGYVSSIIDLSDRRLPGNPQLPDLILTKRTADMIDAGTADTDLPRGVQKLWDRAMSATQERNWAEAESLLREITSKAPKFAQGWSALGVAYQNQKDYAHAREAFKRAVEADSHLLLPCLLLIRVDMQMKDWKAAVSDSDELLKRDRKYRYLEAYLQRAVAFYHLGDFDRAAEAAREAIRLDIRNQVPRAEFVLGSILEVQHDLAGAREHMLKYLERSPHAADAAEVRARIENLGKSPAPQFAFDTSADDTELAIDGETSIPGGIQVLSALAHLSGTSYSNFFAEFSRAIVHETSPWNQEPVPDFLTGLREFMGTAAELAGSGERRDDTSIVRMSLADAASREKTSRILPLLGWRVVDREGSPRVEPGDSPSDGPRQLVPRALGIDEIEMQESLEAGRTYEFKVPAGSARLLGGAGWNVLLKGVPPFPGGIAELFARDFRFARTYAGLSAMPVEAAAALVKGAGLRALVTRDSDALALFGAAIRMDGGRIAIPGGVDAEPVWAALAGAQPRDVPAFLRDLMVKDKGRLAAFYSALAGADAGHQRFFLKTTKRASQFYAWYRDSDELRWGIGRPFEAWRAGLFKDLPLDSAGNVAFPGGKKAWGEVSSPDEEVLTGSEATEALVPIARVERVRNGRLDEESVRIIARHYVDWRFLFPYFEQLHGLGRAEFQALEKFTERVTALPVSGRNAALGEWFSVVGLTALGTRSGAIDAAAGAKAFRRASDQAPVLDIVRELAGTASPLDEAVIGLLRLSAERRAAFDRLRAMERAPHLDAGRAALVGILYAALLDPDSLLVSEDPRLFSRHRFATGPNLRRPALFLPTALIPAAQSSNGAVFTGGFMTLAEVAAGLARRGGSASAASTAPLPMPAGGDSSVTPEPAAEMGHTDAIFHADGRLVEVHATVRDSRGRYIDDLEPGDFDVLEEGERRDVIAFEPRTSKVLCALLLDTTGSMHDAIAALKSAAFSLIDDLRPNDQVAVYSFNQTVSELSPFTSDKAAAKRAVMRTRAFGETALYDALVRVNQDLAGQVGKKVIVVFTDGVDNRSMLTTEAAVLKAKAAGIPIYTIAQGQALSDADLLKHLSAVSGATGGMAFKIRDPKEIRGVFESVSQDLAHGYLLAIRPRPGESRGWRNITVTLKNPRRRIVRAREGFYSE